MPHVTPLLADDPRRVGRYRLTGRIAGMHADGPAHPGSVPEGTAGMPADGPVYLGRSPEGGEVAVRLFKVDSIGDGAERDRFAAEAKAACRVAPFCAAQILGAGFEGGHAFLVSEYVAGPSLEEFVAEEGPWEGRDLLALAIGTATGLAAIHQAAGVAVCLAAIVAVILFVQSQDSRSPSAAKPPASDGPAAASSGPSPSAPLPTPAVRVPAALAGTWSGQVSQTNPTDVFQAQVYLAPGAKPGTVHYSGASFSCAGNLVPVSDSAGNLKLDQAIVQGPCAAGVVTVSRGPGNTLQFSFKGKQGPMATGTLDKS